MLCIAVLYGPFVAHIGFLSDDWSLMDRLRTVPFWHRIEGHHYSLIVNLLLKGAVAGAVTPLIIHALALLVHTANSLIIYFLGDRFLGLNPPFALILALLFAVNPAGMEAVVWCCSIGYVLCSFWILLGLYLFWSNIDRPAMPKRRLQLSLMAIQLFAFIVWDWGIVLTPALIASAVILPFTSLRERISLLMPVAVLWWVILLAKKLTGQDFGYLINTPKQMLINLISSPFIALYPQGSKAFYRSLAGIVCILATTLLFIWRSWRDRKTLLTLAVLVSFALPFIVLGYPQSRYFYLIAFPISAILLRYLQTLSKAGAAFAFALLAAHLMWSYERISLWKEASTHAEQLAGELVAIAKKEVKPLVVINLPDRHGPEDMIWLPFLWRCGIEYFIPSLKVVYTPDCPNLPQDKTQETIAKERLPSIYSDRSLYEVVFRKDFFIVEKPY